MRVKGPHHGVKSKGAHGNEKFMSFFERGGSLRLAPPALCIVHSVYENALLFSLEY